MHSPVETGKKMLWSYFKIIDHETSITIYKCWELAKLCALVDANTKSKMSHQYEYWDNVEAEIKNL